MAEQADPADRAVEANARFHPVNIDSEIVTRPVSSSTETIHSFLRHLRAQGLTCVPEPLGVDERVERLRFIEGASGSQGWYHQHTDAGVASAARLLRVIHCAGKDWHPPEGATWQAPPVEGNDVVFCHGDPGPWNFVWRDTEAIGLLDWDYLHPAPRLNDVAYAVRWFAPFRSDEHALDWHHFPTLPNRRERARTFIDSYGGLQRFDVVGAVLRRMHMTNDLVQDLANRGVEPQRTWVADGELKREAQEMEWIEQHRSDLTL
jgi:hypothetical protein